MFLTKYSCYVFLLASYVLLTKNTFRNIYRRITRLPPVQSALFFEAFMPVDQYWFYCANVDGEKIWKPFSLIDSDQLEIAFQSSDTNEQIISTDGGRYDVNLLFRKREAVYWSGSSSEVRRCSWFYKSYNDLYFTPFEEHIAEILECEYRKACETNCWRETTKFPNGDSITFYGPDNIILLPSGKCPRQRLVKRGIDDEFEIPDDELDTVDHLVFVVHGIGAVCDLKFRSIEEVVTIFREKVTDTLKKKNKTACSREKRVEILPINWHKALHNKNSKTDKNLQSITLESLPLLRNFTNDTLIDILLYTSTIYSQDNDESEDPSSITFSTRVPFAQIILTAVTNELNRIYDIFTHRNPNFNGEVSLMGHSLGSVIIFDLLCHQKPQTDDSELQAEKKVFWSKKSNNRINLLTPSESKQHLEVPQLMFEPLAFFAIGSPIGLFLTVRGIDKLGTEFSLPTCKTFLNIFHPCDPIAYRIEPLVNHELEHIQPLVVSPGDTQNFFISIKNSAVKFGKNVKTAFVKYIKEQCLSILSTVYLSLSRSNVGEVNIDIIEDNEELEGNTLSDDDQNFGHLNQGQRIDYSLQESSIQCLNEYVCAVTSHASYWDSSDVIQLLLRELFPNMRYTT